MESLFGQIGVSSTNGKSPAATRAFGTSPRFSPRSTREDSRSRPHGSPRSNVFGRRVREGIDEPWLAELVGAADRRSSELLVP